MALTMGSTVLDVADVRRAARFWCEALGYVPRDGWADDFMVLRDLHVDGGPQLSLQKEDAPKRAGDANRVHLDLYADDQAREVARLEKLGASRAAGWPYPPDADFVVMLDPDGNEFCVVQKS
jgi:catechol 2,3-dioxygenase-like lactoylglutathione lyase family enzyme